MSEVAFPLTRQQLDSRHGLQLVYWLCEGENRRRVVIEGEEAVCFLKAEDEDAAREALEGLKDWRLAPLRLKTLANEPVLALYCKKLRRYHEAIKRLQSAKIALMEEDIRPCDRYLMERFITVAANVREQEGRVFLQACDDNVSANFVPHLRLLSFDIETTMNADKVLSVSWQSSAAGKEPIEGVLLNGDSAAQPGLVCCADEAELLKRFIDVVQQQDPDILIGWNVIGFDLRVLEQRFAAHNIPFTLGREVQSARIEKAQNGRWYARIPGRLALDGIDTLKGATWRFERYNLDFIAHEFLGRGKAIENPADRGQEIQRLYAEDKPALIHYNLEDSRLVTEIFAKAELIEYLIERARLTGLALDKVGGSQQAFDNLYLPLLHRKGHVAPEYASGTADLEIPGGFVMDSLPGLYDNVLVLDFKSLYPSIIRTFQIDPLGLAAGLSGNVRDEDIVPGFNGAFFDKSNSILPGIIERLWAARDQAKQEGHKALQQAIKIQMNACYGVLGSNVCRFFDQRLSGSITLRGHQILQQSAERIESHYGFKVIYGDTDSVFVWLGDDWNQRAESADTAAFGRQLAQELNAWWQAEITRRVNVDSCLELQFETHFARFLMPRMRHSDKGSKKRYAGAKVTQYADGKPSATQLVFKGLESVRTDWTALARGFQQTLYQRIFDNEDIADLVSSTVQKLFAGEYDSDLIYHRRLRRLLADYVHQQPPHIKAARQLERWRAQHGMPVFYHPGDSVRYLLTLNGPQPVELTTGLIDYQHYVDKQLKPVADSILPFIGLNFEQLIAPQLDLF